MPDKPTLLPNIPSQRVAELAKRAKERDDKQHQEAALLRAAANELAATAQGRAFLKHVARLCGRNTNKAARRYEKSPEGHLVLVDVSANATIYHAARESVWLEIRQLLDAEHIWEAETR